MPAGGTFKDGARRDIVYDIQRYCSQQAYHACGPSPSVVAAWTPNVIDFGPNIGPRLRRAPASAWIDKSISITRPLVLAVLLVLSRWGPSPRPTTRGFSTSKVEIRPNEVLWTVDAEWRASKRSSGFRPVRSSSPRPSCRRRKRTVVTYLLECLKVEINGNPVEGEAGALEPVFATGPTGQKYIS